MSTQRARGLARLAILGVVFAIVAILFVHSKYGIIGGATGSYPHQLQVTVPSAFEAIPGERVTEAGIDAGKITSANVTRTGQAHLVLGLNNSAWPLPTDTVMTLRMGGTIKFTDRFVEVTKGHASRYFADDASLPAKQFVVPVEYNQLFDIFDTKTRGSLQSFFAQGGPTLEQAAQPFHRALPLAPPVLNQASAVFQDLGYNQQALSTLVASTATISNAVASSNPGVRDLIQGAGNTFSAIAADSSTVSNLIAHGRRYGIDIANILFKAGNNTLYKLADMSRRLEPGVHELNTLARPLDQTLGELVSIEPTAVHALSTVRRAGPTIDTLLASARTKLLPQLTSIGNQGATELSCLRPYTPDIMNVVDTFAGFQDGFNNPHVHILHTLISLMPYPNTLPINTVQLTKLFPNMHVGVHPPGTGWNQPWYQPQCGITPLKNTAAADSENGTFDPSGSKLVPFSSTTPSFSPGPVPRGIPVRTTP